MLYEGGKPTGTTTISQGAIGLQIGGQTFDEIVFFEDEHARFEQGNFELDATASAVIAGEGATGAVAYEGGVAVFVADEKGAMAEASVGGQKFTYTPTPWIEGRPFCDQVMAERASQAPSLQWQQQIPRLDGAVTIQVGRARRRGRISLGGTGQLRFQYPSQRLQDWLSQRWVMWRGRRIEPSDVPWLMGPYGNVDVIADQYVERLAAEEHLLIDRTTSHAGLLASIEQLELDEADARRLRPEIAAFYEHTADYDLEFWSQWNPLFRPFASLIHHLYSRRLQQLNLPLSPLEASRGVTSDLVLLRCASTGKRKYTAWYRILKSTRRVIYSGIYSTCRPPDGPTCVKVVFPLPRGNATVILRPQIGADGELNLHSSGSGFGAPGFYFLLVDSKGRHWAQYVRSFREHIRVFVDPESVLRTDHMFSQWGLQALQLHYRIFARSGRAA